MTSQLTHSSLRFFRTFGFCLLIFFLLAPTVYADQHGCPPIGAIRWDAWHGKDGPVGIAVEKSLGPQQWHYRVPFCGRISGPNQVEIECDSQEVMDKEIHFARQAGLSYWAFLAYESDNAMSKSLNYYLASSNKNLVKFSLIMQFLRWGSPKDYDKENSRIIKLMKEPSYQKFLENRPLLFIYKIEDSRLREIWGGTQGFRKVIDQLRGEARASGLGNPFIVVMEPNPERAKKLLDAFGFDAISTYATHSGKAGASYSDLAKHDRAHWERSKKTGAKVVPLVMAGWDNRPRAANPSAWQMERAMLGKVYYNAPGPDEIAAHVSDAVRWSIKNASFSTPNPIIIYAWNEHDEGGWLEPTLSEGSKRIDAVGKAVRSLCPSK